MKKYKFTLGVEKLIDPITVGTLHFLQSLSDGLPTSVQQKMVKKSSKKNPLMGFVVDPYCYFLCYEIENKEFFKSMIPENFELTKTKVFADDTEKYYFILGSFNARTSGFLGSRVEAYAICKNKDTGLTSWVILDYDTNTISYDTKNGLTKPNSNNGTITSDFLGNVIVDMQNNDKKRKLIFSSNISKGTFKKLDYSLWVEGNLSVGYSKLLSDDGDVFSLKFDPREMNKALEIDNVDIEENTWYSQHLKKEPSKLVCFPYAQHFISDSPGYSSNLKNEEELLSNINGIDFDDIEVYSSDQFKKTIVLLPLFLLLIIIILIFIIITLI